MTRASGGRGADTAPRPPPAQFAPNPETARIVADYSDEVREAYALMPPDAERVRLAEEERDNRYSLCPF